MEQFTPEQIEEIKALIQTTVTGSYAKQVAQFKEQVEREQFNIAVRQHGLLMLEYAEAKVIEFELIESLECTPALKLYQGYLVWYRGKVHDRLTTYWTPTYSSNPMVNLASLQEHAALRLAYEKWLPVIEKKISELLGESNV